MWNNGCASINGAPFSRRVQYGNPTPHIAEVDNSNLTTASGPLQIVAYAVWTLGPGQSQTVDVTITCHSADGSRQRPHASH